MEKVKIITCIYCILNEINSKKYIGYTTNFKKRRKEHRGDLRRNSHHNEHLQKAYNKYGKDNFKFIILEECSMEDLPKKEHEWCIKLNTHNRKFGYNILPTNENGKIHKISQETKDKLSKLHKGKKKKRESALKGAATRKKQAEERGFWFAEESLKKMKDKLTGRKLNLSEEELRKKRNRMLGNTLRKGLKPSNNAIKKSKLSRMRSIEIYNLKGDYITTLESITEVANFVKSDKSTISACLAGRQNQSKGYQFKYLDEFKKISDISLPSIFCKCISNNEILTFENILIASKELNISKTKIYNNIKGFSKIAEKKYIFKKNKEEFI